MNLLLEKGKELLLVGQNQFFLATPIKHQILEHLKAVLEKGDREMTV